MDGDNRGVSDAPLRLRPFRESDLALLTRLATDPAFSAPFEWFGFKWSAEGLRRRWEEDGFLSKDPHYLAVARGDELAIGWVMWREAPLQGHGVWEIGALLAPEHRSRGAGTAAQRLLVEYLFATTPAHRIWAGTEVENETEQRSLEKCGFRREGLLRGAQFRDGQWRDVVVYGQVREDAAAPHDEK
jgi:RimJ/RimL family protein N-acetyltransferase